MTLKEFREKTDWMSPDTEIIVNWELMENLEVYSLMTDQEDGKVILRARSEDENETSQTAI